MISKRWFRFGLPLGSATVVAALLDTTIGVYWLLNDLGSDLFFHWMDHNEPVDNRTIINLVLISIRCVLALSLWVFVLLKQRAVLIFWIPLSVICDVLFFAHTIISHPHDFVSDELWIFNIFSLFVFRVYISAVIFQTLKRLLRNARLQSQPLPAITITDTTTGESPKYYLVEPIGRNPFKIWMYFDDRPRLGAAVLVSFEISWNIFVLSTHTLTEFLLGGRMFFLYKEEEIIMRFWRILIDFVALYFILKKRKTFLRFWLIIYFWTLFLTICLTVWTVVDWTFETPLVVVLVTCYNALSDIAMRFGVLYFCLMLSLQASLSVSRTHSLKSETRSIRFTAPNATHNHNLVNRAILAGNQF
ncbi:hypothetical protein Ocin01_10165 [Orchesella cincta]|uniref:Transmembrane protein n=1 Tax=Orchesella cincta TaxID=48709 RepID=A0A1D2MU26_ORCCI|nr:hypothetical protein Ocin01_10165 [Orchesella cincta]